MNRVLAVSLLVCALGFGAIPSMAAPPRSHPRPSGYAEPDAPSDAARIEFRNPSKNAGLITDIEATFPSGAAPEFDVRQVDLNGQAVAEYQIENHTVLNKNGRVHGIEDFSVALYAGWTPGQTYRLVVRGVAAHGEEVQVAVEGQAPAEYPGTVSMGFSRPTPEFPYHYATITLSPKVLQKGEVKRVEIDGQWNRDVRCLNTGLQDPQERREGALEGETFEGMIDGTKSFQIIAPVPWINGSAHRAVVSVVFESGEEKVFEVQGSAPGSGGYWNAAWPHYTSLVVRETAGLLRQGEPVHAMLGVFEDTIADPVKDLRVVAYDPTSPKAGADGYVVVQVQVTDVHTWHNKKMLNSGERDTETGELVHRYDPTTTVEFLFLADVQPYEEKVFQVLYGNAQAEATAFDTDLGVTNGEGLAQTVTNAYYEIGLASNSGAVETVKVLGEGEPILLEHKLETNGAVHWNPGVYSPPTPWVHASDWENPDFAQVRGPLMHRTRKYAPLPHMPDVPAHVSYEFYAHQPYVLETSLMEVQKDMYVQALRNGELVFNHAVLNEFVWMDAMGEIQRLDIESSRKHPIHALEIPPDTAWMAFINREQKVGFAGITLAYENTNRYGDMPSEGQPYFYVQNGPWIYWSRPIVYPFGGSNFTRLMHVRKGTMCYEKNAWLPFRLAEGDQPFTPVLEIADRLNHPLHVHEWMPTDPRTPETWVMPILTMPFNEGVAGAVSGHKEKKEE